MQQGRTADMLTIGEMAARTGLAVSAIRFYDERGLIRAERDGGGRRVFPRSTLRRLSFVLITQRLGYSLAEIGAALDDLPHESPSAEDWASLARRFRTDLDDRIEHLTRLRDRLDGCIGCGCLSLDACAIYNPDDQVAERGVGPRLVVESGP
ncbi:MAG: redox-sensitive transcriptional activator SoxR [Actinomycetota bacterium]